MELLSIIVPVITAVVTAVSSIVAVVIQTKKSEMKTTDKLNEIQTENKMFSAKQAILQMISEDEIAVKLMGSLPTNHSRILYEYDIYKSNNGNSDIDEKMDEYRNWYSTLGLVITESGSNDDDK